MRSECTILMQIPQNLQKRPPAGGNYPFPPFGASRLSLRSCWALVSPGNGGSGSAPGVQCYLLRSIKLLSEHGAIATGFSPISRYIENFGKKPICSDVKNK